MSKKLLLVVGFLLPLAGVSLPSYGQQSASRTVPGYYALAPQTGCTVGPCFVPYGSTIPVSGTFSASLAGFQATSGATASLSVSGTSSSVNLPAGTDMIVTNTGSNTAYIRLTAGASTALTTDMALVAGAAVGLHITTETVISAITASSTTTLNIQGGSGLVAGYGGGSSSGGGSGADVGSTGSAVPSSAGYQGLNVAGTLRGATAVNPSGSVYAQQVDIASIAGTTQSTGAGAVGTGTARVAVGQDTTTVAGAAPTTTGIYVTGPSAAALATSAKQDTINTSINSVVGTKNAGTAATNSELVGGVYNSTPLTLTNTQQSSLQLDSSGYLKVNVATGGGSGGTSSSFGSAFPSTGTAIGASDGTNMQALKVDSSGFLKVIGGYAQGSTTSGQTGVLELGAVTTSAPSYTTAQSSPLSLQTDGSLRVSVTSATGVAQGSTTSGQTLSPVGYATLTSAPTYTTAQTNIPWLRTNGAQAIDLYSINGTTVSTGTGAQGSGTPRVTVATDTATIAGSAPGTAGSASSNVVTVQGVASMTPVQVSQATASNLNATVVGTGTFAVQSAPTASTAGGVTKATITAAASTNATNLKSSAGTLYHLSGYNNSATLAWVSLYNTSGTPTCGTSIVWQGMIPANSTSGAGFVEDFAVPLDFSTGIGYCITTGIAGTGSVAASSYVVNFGYK